MRKNNPLKTVFVFIFVVIVSWKIFVLYQKEQSEKEQMKTESVEVKGIVDYVSRSGTRTNVFTNMGVKYVIDGESFYETIKRRGYKEGLYKQGDTILVYINPKTKKIDK